MSKKAKSRFAARVPCDINVRIVARERGKIVDRYEGHNIWVNTGREWIAKRINATSWGPPVVEESVYVIRWMGFGIGGNKQIAPALADAEPLSTDYPDTIYPTSTHTDSDPNVFTLERPVKISGTDGTAYPDGGGNKWLKQVNPGEHNPTPYVTEYVCLFEEGDLNFGPYSALPLSEIGLFTDGLGVGQPWDEQHLNTLVAYDTFETLTKTMAIAIEVSWTLKF